MTDYFGANIVSFAKKKKNKKTSNTETYIQTLVIQKWFKTFEPA